MLLTKYLEKLVHRYAYLVADNEAGLEHISRLMFRDLDLLLIISDASQRGIQAAGRILDLTRELGLAIRKTALIINRAPDDPLAELEKIAGELGLLLAGRVPEDSQIREWDLKGRPMIGLEKENKALKAAQAIFDRLL
jgi:CO dehydrogenase maturation factor